MILDANLLVYAVDRRSPHHQQAAHWLTDVLNGEEQVGLPWQSLGAFLRIVTHPRITEHPMSADDAQTHVDRWLAAEPAWIPPTTGRTATIYADLARRHRVTGNLVPDAQLAAIALEYGTVVMSADSDFGLP